MPIAGVLMICCLSVAREVAQQAVAPPPPTVAVAVRGVVLDSQMLPAANVALAIVVGEAATTAPALASPPWRSGADGSFALDLQVEKSAPRWLAIGGGRFATAMFELSTQQASTTDLGAFALAPGCTAAGRVRDAEGAPLADVRVIGADLLDTRAFLANRDRSLHPVFRTVATTGATGMFQLAGMVQSAGRLQLRKDGFYDALLQPIGLGDPLDLTLTRAPTIRGRVVAVDGQPLAGARVTLGEQVASTDAAGGFALSPRRPGVMSLRVAAQVGQIWLRKEQAVGDPSAEAVIRLEAARQPTPAPAAAPAPFRVAARAPDGSPVREFTAFVSFNPPNQLQFRCDAQLLTRIQQYERSWLAEATDGVAVVAGGKRGRGETTAMVYVFAPGFALGRVELADAPDTGEPVVVPLAPECIVRGRVVDAATLAPIAGAIVLATQRLNDLQRPHLSYDPRFVDHLLHTPTRAATDADGRYELRTVMAGDNDLFVRVPGRIDLRSVELKLAAGERREGVDWQVPANLTLRGAIPGNVPRSAQIRVHWHRPGMLSSSWPTEFDGLVPLAADGTFTIADLQPKPWQVQLVCAGPPRSGLRLKLPCGLFDGAAGAPAGRQPFDPGPVRITGTVGGPVPWQRLAVAAMWQEFANTFTSDFRTTGPIALVQQDRSFLLLVPRRSVHVLLFDVLTGAPLEWQQLDLDQEPVPPQSFAGAAVAVPVRLVAATGADTSANHLLEWLPDDEHWPAGIGGIAPANFGARRTASTRRTEIFVGQPLQLWLPARCGTLGLRRDLAELQAVKLDARNRGPVEFELQAESRR